jgi:uroporphyrinogen-III synthase
MKRILITRPKSQARDLEKFLQSCKSQVFIEPIFKVENLEFNKITKDFSSIIITSINAFYALEKIALDKGIKIFVVGKKSAQKLQESGFTNVIFSSENSAESLFDLVNKEKGKILYLRGEKISFDFAKKLNSVSETIVYRVIENESFSPEFLQFCRDETFDEILFFSQNSVEIFFKLAKKHNLLEYFKCSKIVGLSNKIIKKAEEFGFKNSETFAANPILKKFYE